MATSPKASSISARQLASLRDEILRLPRWIFDPVDMEHILTSDPALGRQLTAQRLETQAEVHRVVAEGNAKAAKLLR